MPRIARQPLPLAKNWTEPTVPAPEPSAPVTSAVNLTEPFCGVVCGFTDNVVVVAITAQVPLTVGPPVGCATATNLLGNPGFESPVLPPNASAPVSVGNWLPYLNGGATAPVGTTSLPRCGMFSGHVTTGYWVQDLPTTFDPTHSFEFSFWFKPAALGNAVSLVSSWPRSGGPYTNIISLALTSSGSGGFQTQPVVGPKSVNGSPVVSANTWHRFDALTTGRTTGKVSLAIDGQTFATVKMSAPAVGSQVTVVMGATGGPNSTGATDVAYDDVYLGPWASTKTGTIAGPNPAATNQTVTYTAVVSNTGPNNASGVVTFTDNGALILGCENVPAASLLGVLTAICQQNYAVPGTH